MTDIILQIDDEAAKLFQAASSDDQKKISLLLSLWLKQFDSPSNSLTQIMDRISQNAIERGLTPDILEVLLNDR